MVKYNGLSTLEVLEGANNYNRWIAESFFSQINPPALEIGAGIGNLTSVFSSKVPLLVTDKDHSLTKYLKEKFSNKKGVSVCQLDVCKKIPDKYLNRFSTVISINVLEHIEDDLGTLKNLKKLLKKNGRLLLFVPAKKFAYSRLDKDLGHFRRYEKSEIKNKLLESGYKIEKIYYFNIVGLLSWFIRDKISRNYYLKPHQIAIFDSICPLLQKIEGLWKPPLGISLVIHARKI